MTSGGCEVDVRGRGGEGGEGPNCQNNALDHPFERIIVLDSRH